jgi:hypothetical protein
LLHHDPTQHGRSRRPLEGRIVMKIVSVLAALACCGATLSLAFGHALSGTVAILADSLRTLAMLPALGFDFPEALALLGALVVFWSSTRRSEDM